MGKCLVTSAPGGLQWEGWLDDVSCLQGAGSRYLPGQEEEEEEEECIGEWEDIEYRIGTPLLVLIIFQDASDVLEEDLSFKLDDQEEDYTYDDSYGIWDEAYYDDDEGKFDRTGFNSHKSKILWVQTCAFCLMKTFCCWASVEIINCIKGMVS